MYLPKRTIFTALLLRVNNVLIGDCHVLFQGIDGICVFVTFRIWLIIINRWHYTVVRRWPSIPSLCLVIVHVRPIARKVP
jgi:hypothetical protein